MENTKKTSVKKVLSIVGNTLLWLFVAFAIVITVIVFASNNKSGDNSLPSIGGLAFVSIKSNSMDRSPNSADYAEGGRLEGQKGFKKGALIFVNTLTDTEKLKLEVGDVITYSHDLDGDGVAELNTHRIIEVHVEGINFVYYVTQGDHNLLPDGAYDEVTHGNDNVAKPDGYVVSSIDVLGKWNGHKIGGVGNALEFLQTRVGFFVVIILPLIAFFLYELVRFVMVVLSLKGKKSEDEIRMRVMEEILRAQQAANAPSETQTPAPEAEETPTEEPKGPEDESKE